jgi:hypothetical protein
MICVIRPFFTYDLDHNGVLPCFCNVNSGGVIPGLDWLNSPGYELMGSGDKKMEEG